ncbi:MAG: histidine kinase [Nostoc sp.]|uniref:histidine kinase n=1 Tax=Nostoc sp. TaxID=1180 RepID=UPI002FFD1EBB
MMINEGDEGDEGDNAQFSMPNSQCPILNAQFPMPNSQCPILNAQFPMPFCVKNHEQLVIY